MSDRATSHEAGFYTPSRSTAPISSGRKAAWVTFVILSGTFCTFIAIAGGRTESCWVGYWIGLFLLTLIFYRGWWFDKTSLVLAALILIAHVTGFRIIGSARVYENSIAPKLEKWVKYDEAGFLVMESGEKVKLSGLLPKKPLVLKDMEKSDTLEEMVDMDGNSRFWMVDRRIQKDGSAQVFYPQRLVYWCGNTFFSCPFPRNLPKYQAVDLAHVLMRWGCAVPDGSNPEYEIYWKGELQERTTPATPHTSDY